MNTVIRQSGVTIISFVLFLVVPTLIFAEPYWIFFVREQGWTPGDPVQGDLINAVSKAGFHIRTVSCYFNAVSLDCEDPSALECIEKVISIQQVKKLARSPYHRVYKSVDSTVPALVQEEHILNYGVSYRQLDALNIPHLHDMGLTGKGVVIGVLDSGFNIAGTGCLENISVSHKRNFITDSDDITGDMHGVHVLACIGGAHEQRYYGAAFGATFLLAVTDDITETRADEDRWVAAVEWCDSLGANIISSSLVYNIFDTPEESYSKSDMDGRISLVARAAEIAFSRGIVMVNSAGNEGDNSWRIITTPGDAEHVIAVGAVSITENAEPVIADFSSRGPTADGRIKPDVVAPGEMVAIPYPGTPDFYFLSKGTSLAAPFIAGLCALLLEAHPYWTPSTVIEALKESARDLGNAGPDNDYGWGIPDGVLALEYIPMNIVSNESDKNGSGSKEKGYMIPSFVLYSPYPNPFNSVVTIPYRIDTMTHVTLDICDITGRTVSNLIGDLAVPGEYQVLWYAGEYASGVYFARIVSESKVVSKKITMVK